MRSAFWVIASAVGFALTGMALHSPGASAVGNSYFAWDVSAALFGAILGLVAGGFTGLLQIGALHTRSYRLVVATALTVAVAHALADGAPGEWGVTPVAVLSGLVAAVAQGWAIRTFDPRNIALVAASWAAGWIGGTALAGALGLSGGSAPGTWAAEHAVIGAVIGLTYGAATAPAARRILGGTRALSSVG